MDQMIIFFFAAILIIGAAFFAIICFTKKGSKKLDVEKYRIKFLAIENQLKRDDSSSYHLCVLNADKLVDEVLRERGFRGETMGERMKAAASSFSDRNGIWMAHKLRNQIAHDTDADVTYNHARQALASFKRAMRDLGAL